MKPALRSRRLVRARSLLITLAALSLLFWSGAFLTTELSAVNAAFNLRPRPALSAPVVIVAVDQESFDQTGLQWPWPRDFIAGIVNQISAGRPKVIVLDAFFYEADMRSGGDPALGEAIRRAGNVVVTNDILQKTEAGYEITQLRAPIPAVRDNVRAIGLANFSRDDDAFVRRMFQWQTYEGAVQYAWSYQAVALYLGVEPDAAPAGNHIQLGTKRVPLVSQQLLINFIGPPRTFPYYPAYQVANGEVAPESFAGKIVIFGATDESLHDTYPTPFAGNKLPMPGAEVNAHTINTLLSGDFLHPTGRLVGFALLVGMALVGYLVSGLRPAVLALLLTFSAVVVYAVLWFGLFAAARVEVDLVGPEVALVLGVFGPTLDRAVSEELEKRRVRSIFERFISPEMVQQLLDTQDIQSLNKRANLTILFSDIRGFTTLSENMDPDSLVRTLNEYLTAMTEIIHKHGGTVDKYEGDAILAFFGEPLPYPDHAQRAVAAALEMRQTLAHLRKKWMGTFDPRAFEIGIGVNTGDVFVGLIGSEKRINYTVIGDNVNLAARLQDLTKDMAWPILISSQTYRFVNEQYETEFAGSRLVKGRSESVAIYKVLGRRGAPEAERVRPMFH